MFLNLICIYLYIVDCSLSSRGNPPRFDKLTVLSERSPSLVSMYKKQAVIGTRLYLNPNDLLKGCITLN